MSLTLGGGPLATPPAGDANYRIEGPAHRLLFQDHPRRIRGELAGRTIFDTTRGRLLHESNLLPVLYVPFSDLDAAALDGPTGHRTHCPFKGDAAYWTLRAGDRALENAVWSYPEPRAGAEWLEGWAALYWDRLDALYEEDDRVLGHLRDPYHRVDARPSSRAVRVRWGDEVVAESATPVLVFETGLPVRAYLRRDAVRGELVASETRTTCPYKGEASYWSLRVRDRLLADAAWTYEHPLEEASRLRGLVSLLHDELRVEIDEPSYVETA